jgi:hypothetical protein
VNANLAIANGDSFLGQGTSLYVLLPIHKKVRNLNAYHAQFLDLSPQSEKALRILYWLSGFIDENTLTILFPILEVSAHSFDDVTWEYLLSRCRKIED